MLKLTFAQIKEFKDLREDVYSLAANCTTNFNTWDRPICSVSYAFSDLNLDCCTYPTSVGSGSGTQQTELLDNLRKKTDVFFTLLDDLEVKGTEPLPLPLKKGIKSYTAYKMKYINELKERNSKLETALALLNLKKDNTTLKNDYSELEEKYNPLIKQAADLKKTEKDYNKLLGAVTSMKLLIESAKSDPGILNVLIDILLKTTTHNPIASHNRFPSNISKQEKFDETIEQDAAGQKMNPSHNQQLEREDDIFKLNIEQIKCLILYLERPVGVSSLKTTWFTDKRCWDEPVSFLQSAFKKLQAANIRYTGFGGPVTEKKKKELFDDLHNKTDEFFTLVDDLARNGSEQVPWSFEIALDDYNKYKPDVMKILEKRNAVLDEKIKEVNEQKAKAALKNSYYELQGKYNLRTDQAVDSKQVAQSYTRLFSQVAAMKILIPKVKTDPYMQNVLLKSLSGITCETLDSNVRTTNAAGLKMNP